MISASQIKRQCQTKETKRLKCRGEKDAREQKAAGRVVKIQRRGKFRNVKDKEFQEMINATWIKRKWHHRARIPKIKKCQGEKQSQQTKRSVKIQKCQEQAGSRESGSIRQRCREQEMSRTKTSKKSRSRRLWQAGGQALFLYRLPLVFIGSSLSRNFRHPACPGST